MQGGMNMRFGVLELFTCFGLIFSNSAFAEDSLKSKLKQKTSNVIDAAKKEAVKEEPKPAKEEPTVSQKIMNAKQEEKAAIEQKVAAEKAKATAKKGDKKSSPISDLKAKASSTEKKIDGAIQSLGK
jgi:hypothetical protein